MEGHYGFGPENWFRCSSVLHVLLFIPRGTLALAGKCVVEAGSPYEKGILGAGTNNDCWVYSKTLAKLTENAKMAYLSGQIQRVDG